MEQLYILHMRIKSRYICTFMKSRKNKFLLDENKIFCRGACDQKSDQIIYAQEFFILKNIIF